ncbi:MAG TPA: SDR family oxidoreductase [Candidatus Kapabacteria bacterium]|nr:SDR family oxidoreductase [Candidatus Kapabacteria bacterium]
MFSIEEQYALICGSSQGIGFAIAKQFAQAGAVVTLLSRNESKLENSLSELKRISNKEHSYIVADMAHPLETNAIVGDFIKENHPFDILVNNTGGPGVGKLIEQPYEVLISAYNQHIISAQLITQTVSENMINSLFGRIINIISVGMKQPLINNGVSNTIRGAMGSWSKSLSKELAPFGITVNNILPGFTLTERLADYVKYQALIQKKSSEEFTNELISDVPLKKFIAPEAIGNAAVFLASQEAAYINGVSLPVDGGYLSCI